MMSLQEGWAGVGLAAAAFLALAGAALVALGLAVEAAFLEAGLDFLGVEGAGAEAEAAEAAAGAGDEADMFCEARLWGQNLNCDLTDRPFYPNASRTSRAYRVCFVDR
jgi:NAD(P)-dependent dehydrogenase (short-subunit alcohol dehydrogenase family)